MHVYVTYVYVYIYICYVYIYIYIQITLRYIINVHINMGSPEPCKITTGSTTHSLDSLGSPSPSPKVRQNPVMDPGSIFMGQAPIVMSQINSS